MNPSSISQLKTLPHFAELLANAHAAEWSHLYSEWNEAIALRDFEREFHSADLLPCTLILHEGRERILGSVSLVFDDLPVPNGMNPWLASLYVFPEIRGTGCGRVLVEAALERFRKAGVEKIYLFTEAAMPFFAKFGFQSLMRCQAGFTIMERVESLKL